MGKFPDIFPRFQFALFKLYTWYFFEISKIKTQCEHFQISFYNFLANISCNFQRMLMLNLHGPKCSGAVTRTWTTATSTVTTGKYRTSCQKTFT